VAEPPAPVTPPGLELKPVPRRTPGERKKPKKPAPSAD
jgi:hypothetical protein